MEGAGKEMVVELLVVARQEYVHSAHTRMIILVSRVGATLLLMLYVMHAGESFMIFEQSVCFYV